jgi:hypothetical protein
MLQKISQIFNNVSLNYSNIATHLGHLSYDHEEPLRTCITRHLYSLHLSFCWPVCIMLSFHLSLWMCFVASLFWLTKDSAEITHKILRKIWHLPRASNVISIMQIGYVHSIALHEMFVLFYVLWQSPPFSWLMVMYARFCWRHSVVSVILVMHLQ